MEYREKKRTFIKKTPNNDDEYANLRMNDNENAKNVIMRI